MRRRTFEQYVVPRPRARWTDAVTNLRRFALVTYDIDPGPLQALLPRWLAPLTVKLDGALRAFVSVVTFMNVNFRPAAFPMPGLTMAQMNYRAYVVDRATGEHGIWFLAILLDSWAFAAPRLLWKMPWYKGPIEIRGNPNGGAEGSESYFVLSTSRRAPARLELEREEREGREEATLSGIDLPGFPDLETGLVCLTHAANGFFRRADGKVGLNRVWHKPIPVGPAGLRRASFPLLDRMGLVPRSRQDEPYSVLLAPEVEMLIRLPPTIVSEG